MSAPAGKQAQKKQAQKPNGAGKPQGKSAPKRKAAPQRRGGYDDDDDESEGSSSDSDAEIGLTAGQNVKATVKPIAPDAPVKPTVAEAAEAKEKKQAAAAAAAATAAAAKSKKQTNKRKAEVEAATEEAEDDDSDGGSDAPAGGADSELIDVEFGIYDPRPADYLTLKMLLKDFVHPASAGIQKKKLGKKKAAQAAAAAAAAAAADNDEEDEEDDAAALAAAAASVSDPDFALHEMCAALAGQACVGSSIKGEGTDEPMGFLSALNLAWQEANAVSEQDASRPVQWVGQLRRYILRHTPAQHRAVMERTLSDPSTGLLIQSRLVNAPPQMVPHLHQCIVEDLAWARENAFRPTGDGVRPVEAAKADASEKEYRNSFAFKQYIFVGRTFRPPAGSTAAKKMDVVPQQQFVSPFASKKKQKRAAAQTASSAAAPAIAGSLPEFEWLRFEEELYARAATTHFVVPCPFTPEDAAAGRLPQRCEFMIVPANALTGIVQQLHAMAAME